MTTECQEWIESQSSEFMRPFAEQLSTSEAREYMEDDSASAGWYSRLSAPGYMDCTDWQGPYDSEDEALEGLFETFGE